MNPGAIGIIVLAQSLICFSQASAPPSVGGPSDVTSLPSQQSSPTRTESNVIVRGRLIHKEDPQYPKKARKQKIQGQVVLQVTVDENGNVGRAAGISGDPSLVGAAEEAVFKWRFEPFTQQGHAVSVQQNLIFNFDLNRKIAELESPLPEPKPLSASVVSHLPIRLRLSNAPPPGVVPGVYRVGGGVSAPRALFSPAPKYSDEASRARFQGTCLLSLIVGPDGLPRDIRVAQSLGMGLDEKAIEAVKQWRFQPALKDGKPVAVAVTIQVEFRL